MKSFVIDANVVIVALIRSQPEWNKATQILEDFAQGRVRLIAPDLIVYEVMNALDVGWRRMGALKETEALAAAGAFLRFQIELHPLTNLAALMLEASKEFNISVYDAAYVTLARALNIEFVTGDRKLRGKLALKAKFVRSIVAYTRNES